MPDGTKINFSSTGLQTSLVDTDGNTTNFGWNASNLLTSITDFNAQATTLGYNASNQVTKITDPAGRSATLAYSSSGNLTSITDPLGAQWQYGYATLHALNQLTDPRGNTTTFNYKAEDRVTAVTQADNTTLQVTANHPGMSCRMRSAPARRCMARSVQDTVKKRVKPTFSRKARGKVACWHKAESVVRRGHQTGQTGNAQRARAVR
jgi:YD repeat-containing protein